MEILLEGKQIKDSYFVVEQNEFLSLNLISFDELFPVTINIDVEENGKLQLAFADFSKSTFKIVVNVNLKGRNSSVNSYLVSNCSKGLQKKFDVNVNHLNEETFALVKNRGCVQEDGTLLFDGCNFIQKGAVKSSTRQDSKIVVFDENIKSRCMPTLKIDENDIQASHAATLGRVNENDLFYLESRGLDKKEARRILIFAMFKPIKYMFFNEEMKAKIGRYIEEEL